MRERKVVDWKAPSAHRTDRAPLMRVESAKRPAGVAAVERALSILQAFREGSGAATLHELAQRTGLYKSTILRLLASLERFDCVLHLSDGRYQLGPMLMHLGSLYQRTLKLEDHIIPVLRQLVNVSGESASFYVPQRSQRLCLFRIDSPHGVRDHVQAGDLLPIDRGAAGRVLLAFGDDASRRLPATDSVIISFGERDRETAAAAAPVFGPAGAAIGALCISGPLSRFSKERTVAFADHLRLASIELTRRLGGDPARLELSKAQNKTTKSRKK